MGRRRRKHDLEYSLQANRKTIEGTAHPDRNAQFEHINERVKTQLKRGQPAISVDTKKKELIGRFKNAGRAWRPQGKPEKVKVHDFLDPAKGKAIPYGVYDLGRNLGWVSVGVDHDTAVFAVATIRRWWRELGRKHYPRATSLLITADSGGSNGSRLRLWKWELQKLAQQTGLIISVCHLPPGTSKWNKIEHRLFSFISQNWRGQPLLTHAAIVSLIAATRTKTGLKVRCVLDTREYPKALKPTDEQMATINLKPDPFHGDWNYTIRPRTKTQYGQLISLQFLRPVQPELNTVHALPKDALQRITGAVVTQETEDLVVTFEGSLLFDIDSSTLKAEGQERLAEVAEALLSQPHASVVLEGHTDERGTSEYNLELSSECAEVVRQYLISRGVAEGRLRSVGYGESQPVMYNHTEDAWSQNQRIELHITLGDGGTPRSVHLK